MKNKHSILTRGVITRIESVTNGQAVCRIQILGDEFVLLACPEMVGKLVTGHLGLFNP